MRYLLIALAVTTLAFHLLGLSGEWLSGFEAGFAEANKDSRSAGAVVGMLRRFDLLLAAAWIPGVAAAVQSVYRTHALNLAEASMIGIYTMAQISLIQIAVASVNLDGVHDRCRHLHGVALRLSHVGFPRLFRG